MKRKRTSYFGRIFLALSLLLTWMSGLFSPWLPLAAKTVFAEEADRSRITCIIPYKPDTVFWQEIGEGMEAAAADEEADLTMIYTETDGIHYTAMDLNSALETAILVHTGAIVLSMSKDADASTEALLRKAREAGIYVVLIDNDVEASLRDVCVTIDNEAAGKRLGELAAGALSEDEKALLTFSVMTADRENMADRISGIRSSFPEGQLLEEKTEALSTDQEIVTRWEEVLEADASIRALLTLNERSTITAAQLLARKGLTGQVKLYGFDWSEDTAELLENGMLTALIGQRQREMGYQSIAAAVRLLRGDTPESDRVYIDYEVYGDAADGERS